MPRKRQLGRLRRVWIFLLLGLSLASLGVMGLLAALGVSRHPQHGDDGGGLLALVTSVVLVLTGLCLAIWSARREPRVDAEEHEHLAARGLDDGLPLGVYREHQRIGLEPTDFLLMAAAFLLCLGVFIASLSLFEPEDGVFVPFVISALIGFLPAALCIHLGSGTRLWLTPDGIESDRWPRKSMRWTEVARIVPLYKSSPSPVGIAQLLDLQSSDAVNGWRRWRGKHFTIRVMLLQVEPEQLLPLLQERLPARAQDGVG